tara:strand:+ start:6688 stop:7005 length:318 start_codon:yes stop_codon:yes gene_type:complete
MRIQSVVFKYTLEKTLLVCLAAFALSLITGYSHAHSGPLNTAAVKVCDNKAKSQACQYEGGHNDLYIGSCQYMVTTLMCVRNQPIKNIEPEKNGAEEEHNTKQHN